ncbi:MAG: dehydrogenase, short-chain alcohol dehydrogenase like protein [Myxococcales bacterium]|nr:dehydrogenase, short-chain alcohol dehydrogenase like protein [Myxococcales bacterium]
MDLELGDKTVLVTGSTGGLGHAAAKLFAREGATVIVSGRTQARVDAARAAIEAEVPRARVRGVTADVGTAAGVATLVAQEPTVDVLVNNVGVYAPRSFEEISDAEWMRYFETNVMSGIRLSRHYLAGMLAKNWGRIIFISSESAIQVPAEMIDYGMTKAAQLAVSRGLAERARGTGITVNCILPGPTRSEGLDAFVRGRARDRGVPEADAEKDFFATARPSSLIGRFETPDEVANLIVYTASQRASGTTGSALRVDGGMVRSII